MLKENKLVKLRNHCKDIDLVYFTVTYDKPGSETATVTFELPDSCHKDFVHPLLIGSLVKARVAGKSVEAQYDGQSLIVLEGNATEPYFKFMP